MSSKTTSSISNKVIVILGPTGSGKTGVAIEIAKAIGGEIISADSRAIYKGMDIGTAKPSLEEQDGVPHFGLDLVEPGERFTVADFKANAEQTFADFPSLGHLPIIAGGHGLYIYEALRERLKKRVDQMFGEKLYTYSRELVQKYGWGSQAMKSNIYQFAWQYLEGNLSLEQAKEQSFYDDWHLAKRQMTWFKRTPEIIWLPLEKIYPYVLKYIQDEQRR